jgi:SAM-dependent methyltransferase
MITTKNRKESVEFDLYAPEYSSLLNDPLRDRFASDPVFFHRRKLILIRDFFTQRRITPSNLRWLDVGCGQGELLRLAGRSFAQAVGCDPSSKMIQSCAQEEVYEQPSPAELPFPDRSFDFVTAVCVYHHVHGGDRALLTKSIRRVLRPGGLFCLIEHNPWNPVTQAIVKRCPVDSDAELLTASAAARLFRSMDLEILETAYFLYFPESIFRRISRIEQSLRSWPLGGQYAIFCRNSGRDSE